MIYKRYLLCRMRLPLQSQLQLNLLIGELERRNAAFLSHRTAWVHGRHISAASGMGAQSAENEVAKQYFRRAISLT